MRAVGVVVAVLALGGCARFCGDAGQGVDAGVVFVAKDAGVAAAPALPPAPIARAETTQLSLHGRLLSDEYAWMKKKGTPEVEAYLHAENAYANAWLERTAALRTALKDEYLSRELESDETVPAPHRGYAYSTRTEAKKEHPIYLRRPLDGGEAQVLLDLNTLSADGGYVGLGEFEVSDDDGLLAYSVDESGFREYTLRFKDLRDAARSPTDVLPHVASSALSHDGRTVFYVVENDAKRPFRLYRHQLGEPVAKDVLLLEEKDEHFSLSLYRGNSERFIYLTSESLTAAEIRTLDAATPLGRFTTILPRRKDVMYGADDRGKDFYLRINDTGRNYRLVRVPIARPTAAPVELIAHRPEVMISGVSVFDGFLAVTERERGLEQLFLVDPGTLARRKVELPLTDYALSLGDNAEFGTKVLRYHYASLATPLRTVEVDVATLASRVLKEDPVPGFDSALYTTERVELPARDGAKIPVSLAWRTDKRSIGQPAPMLLTAYGAYGVSYDSGFQPDFVSLMDRGVVIAVAHVRGGGELGKPWHDAGRLAKKPNTFSDFIDVADGLVKQGVTTPHHLAITGASAGGLLLGTVLNQRPTLFAAALVDVPFVDIISSMLDESLPLTVGEFEEWGNPKLKADFEVMMSYSPYDNVSAQAYPPMLVRSSYNDSQVLFHEPTKYVAKLRALKTGKAPLLLLMQMDPAGHGGRSGRFEAMEDEAKAWAFVLWHVGVRQ